MKDANREYENALAAFAEPGCRWEQEGQLVYNPNVRENNMCFRGQCHGSSLRL